MFEKFDGELLAIPSSHKENDKLGSDYALEFYNGKFEHLDVKVRSRDYYSEADKCNIAIEPSSSGAHLKLAKPAFYEFFGSNLTAI